MEFILAIYAVVFYVIVVMCAHHYAERLHRNVIGYSILSVFYPILTILFLFCLGDADKK